jgi:hypothetical protein
MPETEEVIPWSDMGMDAAVTGAAFDADGTPLDADGNRLTTQETDK